MNYRILLRDGNIQYMFASARHTDVSCDTHLHSSMEIILVSEGTLHMEIGGNGYDIRQGQAVFVSSFESHMFRSDEHNKCHVLMFSKDIVPYFSDFLKTKVPLTHLFTPSAASVALVERILPQPFNNVDYFHAQAVLAPLICEISEQCDFSVQKSGGEDRFFKALEYMNLHFTESITLQSVAKAIGVHSVTLSKMFSQKTKTSFNAFLNYLRCSYAATLIQGGDVTFTEVSYAAGFGSIRSFNRAFLAVYGVTPTAFKNSPKI